MNEHRFHLLFLSILLLAPEAQAEALSTEIPSGSPAAAEVSATGETPPSSATVREAPGRSARRRHHRELPAYTVTLYNVNTRERLRQLKVFQPDPRHPGKLLIRPEARRKLEQFTRDHRTGKVKRGMPDSLWYLLYQIASHFDRPVNIISGYRSTERRSSKHRQGMALDLNITGVDTLAIWDFARSSFTERGVGLGFYPRSDFIHIDVREMSYYWIDDSGQGERSRYRAGVAQPKQQWHKAAARRKRVRARNR